MTTNFFTRLFHVLVLVLLQALILNNIHIFNIATPLLYILLPLKFNSKQPQWSALLWCFGTGLAIDVFANTPGVAAGAMTLIGAIQPYILKAFMQTDDDDCLVPSAKTMGWIKYTVYTMLISLIYSLAFFTLESFSFSNLILWASSITSSAALTIVILLALEKIKR